MFGLLFFDGELNTNNGAIMRCLFVPGAYGFVLNLRAGHGTRTLCRGLAAFCASRDNQNAIEIQIWCALIALLLLVVMHQRNKSRIAFTVFVSILRLHLFNYIALKELLHEYQSKRGKAPPNPNLSLFNSGWPPAFQFYT
jgi:hypothetical protein